MLHTSGFKAVGGSVRHPTRAPSAHRAAPHLRTHSRLGHNKAEAEGVHVGVVVLVERVGRLCVVIYDNAPTA